MSVFNIVFLLRPSSFGNSEGLVVLLADLVKALHALGVRVRIFASLRHEAALISALSANNVSEAAYEVVSFRVAPFAVKLLARREQPVRKRRGVRFQAFLESVRKVALYVLPRLGTVGAVSAAIASLLLLLVVSVPAFVLGAAIFLAVWIRRNLRGVLSSGIGWFIGRVLGTGTTVADFRRKVVDAAFDVEATRLGARVSEYKDVTAVFLPFAFAGVLAESLRCRILLVVPDAVVLKYPTRFSSHNVLSAIEGIERSVKAADCIVCYSAYTRDEQLRAYFRDAVEGKDVHVIPHGAYPSGQAAAGAHPGMKFDNHFPEYCAYIPDYHLPELNYVIYPSVDRPHKNTLTLVKAVHELTRKRYLNLKFLSTSYHLNDDTRAFLLREKFFLDALFPSRLSESDLHYAIRHARILVNPTFSEGGYPFNFSRAVSQGTPALLSDIPVVREMFDCRGISPAVYERWLFDPRDHLALADLIESTLANRQEVYHDQLAVLKQIEPYDMQEMARRYCDVYSQMSKKGRHER